MEKLVMLVVGILLIACVLARREESLAPNDAYIVSWDIDSSSSTVTFNLTVKTVGFVGFGISNGGGMLGADVIIGGVFPNGTKYFDDRHGEGTFEPEIDIIQNYDLLSFSENATHTYLSFSRLLVTGDMQDTEIGDTETNFIWSFGPTDRILYHGPNRGNFPVNITDLN